jgi:gliding motility-associated protein GldL
MSSSGKSNWKHWLFETVPGKTFLGFIYGWGAAIVIVGALFKIMHWPGSSVMLIGGLSIEAIIFIIGAFEPQHLDLDWSLVYPELKNSGEELSDDGLTEDELSLESGLSVTQQLDNMLIEAKIDSDLIKSLGDGMRSLTDQTSKLSNISDAIVATNDYTTSVKTAASNVEKLSSTYSKASESLLGLTENSSAGQSFGEQLQKMSQNLTELNNIYELQLKSSADYFKASSQVYDGINQLMTNLNDSVEDTMKYKENIHELSKNLGALNTIYGNMLNAMNFNR